MVIIIAIIKQCFETIMDFKIEIVIFAMAIKVYWPRAIIIIKYSIMAVIIKKYSIMAIIIIIKYSTKVINFRIDFGKAIAMVVAIEQDFIIIAECFNLICCLIETFTTKKIYFF